MSPVCSMKSGAFIPAGGRLARSIAFFNVPVTSGFAPLLNPMWQSLICTNEKSSTFPAPAPPSFIVCASSLEVGTPPTLDHSSPVPAHAMHPRKFRRSIPSPTEPLPTWSAPLPLIFTISSSLNRFIQSPSRFYRLHSPQLPPLRFIPRTPANNSWNNLSAIRLTERMFHAQPLPVFFAPSPRPCDPAVLNIKPTEALRTMSSAIDPSAALEQSAAIEQLALPL